MFFRMLYDDHLAQASYVIGCQATGDAIVIDPQRDVERYIRLVEGEGMRLSAVTETHIHADFLSGVREMAERTGCTVYLSDEGDADWKYLWVDKKVGGGSYDYHWLKDGDVFDVGNIRFTALHTPGHTPEHISFMVTDRGGGAEEPMGIATGDFVFVGDVGRPDLLETAAGVVGAQDASARVLYQSIRKFRELPDYLQLWPGHGAGSACGKALGAVPQSTVGYEKRFNSAITFDSGESAFVDSIIAGQPAPPLYFGRMKTENKEGPAVLGALPSPSHVSVATVREALDSGAALADSRVWDSYIAGHIPGAISAPAGKPFPTVCGSYIRPDQDIYLVADPGDVEGLVVDLIRIGLDRVVGFITPEDVADDSRAGNELTTIRTVEITELAQCAPKENYLVLDVRNPDEFAAGHLMGAYNAAYTRLLERQNEIPSDRPIWIYCRTNNRSSYAAGFLKSRGYEVVHLTGGFEAWSEAGGPVAD